MKAVVGVFKSRSDAELSAAQLVPLKIPNARINILTPEVTEKEIAAVPTVAGEQPGTGKAMGAVVGGAMGVASGVGLVPLIASLSVPWGRSRVGYGSPCWYIVGRDWGSRGLQTWRSIIK